jgi:outer membrane receptor protein involved in Fe transport
MKLFFNIFFIIICIGLQAQSTFQIEGKIANVKSDKPIAGATLQLFQERPSGDTLIRGTFAKADGHFAIEGIERLEGLYLLTTALGFEMWENPIDLKNIPESGKLDLGNIMMVETANALENVVVTSKRRAFEMKLDKRVFNPETQITAKGGTAVDVMKNIPSITVDAQGGVEMRGSSPQIFVDGRPTILSLDQIMADDIDRIEIITNPSSKYDAASAGGIVNVILKKNRARGLNGNTSFGVGYPDILNGYLGINLRQNKINVFATANYNQSGGRARGETNRTNLQNGLPAGGFEQVSYNDRLRRNGNFRFGIDYFLDNKNTLTLSQGITNGDGRSIGEQHQQFFGADGALNGTGERDELYNWASQNASTQAFYKRTFSKKGRELTADLTYNQGSGETESSFTNYFYTVGSIVPESITKVMNDGGSQNEQVTMQIDYIDPKGENGKLEAGLRYFSNDFSSNFNAFSMDGGVPSKLPFSNNIEYKELIAAGYVNYGNKIEKWGLSYQGGLRIEYSEFNGMLVDSAQEFGYKWPESLGDFTKSMFPSLYLTKELNDKTQLQLNYSRRIRRPNFWQLSPFVDISDPFNIRQGNLNLLPETTHSFELNYNRSYDKGNFMVSGFFRNNRDDITRYSDTLTREQYEALNNAAISPDAILNTFINADFTNRMGVELNLQHRFSDRFDIMPTVNLQYRHVKAQSGDLNLENRGFNWDAQLNANYRTASKKELLDKLAFQLSGRYRSANVIPQGRTISELRVDFAIRRDILKDNKGSVVFAIDDVLNTRRWGSIIETSNFIQDSYSRWNVRSFRLTFSYRFGAKDFQFANKRKGSGEGFDGGGGFEG